MYVLPFLTLLASSYQNSKAPHRCMVQGKVIEKTRNLPVGNAQIVMYNGHSIKRGTGQTNANGHFTLYADSVEVLHLLVLKDGMTPEYLYFEGGGSKDIILKTIKLKRAAQK